MPHSHHFMADKINYGGLVVTLAFPGCQPSCQVDNQTSKGAGFLQITMKSFIFVSCISVVCIFVDTYMYIHGSAEQQNLPKLVPHKR